MISIINYIIDWANSNEPSGIVTWTGILITSVLAIWRGGDYWRDRRRISLRIITSYRHCRYWHQYDIDMAYDRQEQQTGSREFPSTNRIIVNPGDCKSCYEVLEFTLTNRYAHEVTVGCFLIADWIFSDRYSQGMYDRQRDYRVFDLFTREKINLENYRTLAPGGVLGIRLEIFEQANAGPNWISNHLYYKVDIHNSYYIEFNSDLSRFKRKITPSSPEKNPIIYEFDYRWSNDIVGLGPMQRSLGPQMPQAIPQKSPWILPWHDRVIQPVKRWINSIYNVLRKFIPE